MVETKWIALSGAALLLAAGAAFALAQDWGTEERKARSASRGQGGNSSAARLLRYDADRNGAVSRAEIDTGIAASFSAIDTSADGKLDAAEVQRHNDLRRAESRARLDAWRLAPRESRGRPPWLDRDDTSTLLSLDWNLDGFVTPDEFGGKTRAQAMRADRNGDGTLAAEELRYRNRARKTPAVQVAAQDSRPEAAAGDVQE